MGFGKSKAKLLTEKQGRVTFDDVAGVDEAKDELQEIVEFLKDPKKFQRLGGRIPKGVLLVGPPGTGKTLLARAIAGEAGVPFFTISGSDFVEMFVGVGASRVRDMFEQAKKNAPCIIFIDEIDAVGRHRGAGLGGGNDEREQTLNQLLVEMDGFEANEGVILIAATNRPDVLDPALLRPGRFDRQVRGAQPRRRRAARRSCKVHMRKVPLAPDVDLEIIARGTPGLLRRRPRQPRQRGGAAGRAPSKRAGHACTTSRTPRTRCMMGAERRSMIMTDEEKKLTAYHEAGHALVGLQRATATTRSTRSRSSRAAGRWASLSACRSATSFSMTASTRCEAHIAMVFGGRVAEELIFGDDNVTTGAASDIKQATELARPMVTEWGMSDKLGPLRYNENQEEVFLGHSVPAAPEHVRGHGPADRRRVRRIVDDGEKKAREVLNTRIDDLHAVAEALLEYETLTNDEVQKVLNREPIERKDSDDRQTPTASSVPVTKRPTRGPKGTGDMEPQPQA